MTDGHYLFDAKIAHQGRFPAMDFTLSITRVGKRTQNKVVRKLSEKMAILLSRYLRTESYAHLGAELSSDVQLLIQEGEQLTALISQDSDDHFPLSVQVALGVMIIQGWLKDVPAERIKGNRATMTKLYEEDEMAKQLLDNLLKTEDLDGLIKMAKDKKTQLLNLCRQTQTQNA